MKKFILITATVLSVLPSLNAIAETRLIIDPIIRIGVHEENERNFRIAEERHRLEEERCREERRRWEERLRFEERRRWEGRRDHELNRRDYDYRYNRNDLRTRDENRR
jgi:hypothetical protein